MIQQATVYEIRCDSCGRRWGDTEEPERIIWDPDPLGIHFRMECTNEGMIDDDQWRTETTFDDDNEPVRHHYCPDCKAQ